MKIGEFIVQLGVLADTKKVKDFVQAIGDMSLESAGAIGMLGTFSYQLKKFTEAAVEASVQLHQFKTLTGLSTIELQRWQNVAEMTGGSAQDATSDITGLQNALTAIRYGQGNIKPFQFFGIDPRQGPFQILEQLRKVAQTMPRDQFRYWAQQMGISANMLNLLTLSTDKFNKMAGTTGQMTEKQTDQFYRLNIASKELSLTIKYFVFAILAPFAEHLAIIIEGILRFRTVIKWLGVALLPVAMWFFPITAAVIGLILLLDDLAVYFSGGDSLIGRAIDGIKRLAKEFVQLTKGFTGLDALTRLAASLATVGVMTGSALGMGGSGSSTQQTNHITVHGNDPDATGAAVKNHLDRKLRTATSQVDKGGY